MKLTGENLKEITSQLKEQSFIIIEGANEIDVHFTIKEKDIILYCDMVVTCDDWENVDGYKGSDTCYEIEWLEIRDEDDNEIEITEEFKNKCKSIIIDNSEI